MRTVVAAVMMYAGIFQAFLRRCPIIAMLVVVVSLLATAAYGNTLDNMCSKDTCKVGTTVVTYATKTDPYFACPTRELSDYVTTVLGFVEITEITASLTGNLPNISDKTGEPEFEGDTKNIVDGLRTKAEVTTYDQAVALCQRGKSGKKVVIINIPDDMLLSVWVYDRKADRSFWMPLGALNKQP